MFCCLISSSDLYSNFLELKYSIINSSEEIKVDKTFKIDFKQDKLTYFKFSQHQFKEAKLFNYIEEIYKDFERSKYILGKSDFHKYFFKINELDSIKETFLPKYIKLTNVFEKIESFKQLLL